MLKFNTLLRESGADPKDVQLVRHQDRGPTGVTPYSLVSERPDLFEFYQSVQGREIFRRKLFAAFVVTPSFETLFVNLYAVGAPQRNSSPQICPVRAKVIETGKCWIYPTALDDRLEDFSKKLIVDWGGGYRSWVQRADRQDKAVLELRSLFNEPEFPSYLNFQRRIEEIPTLFPTWKAVLSRTKGVYLLIDQENGGQYVGSATGEQGFIGRWLVYAKDGHGGNAKLKLRNHKNYVVSILETAGSTMGRHEILEREAFWKEKLG
ncbi:MAG: GIY-YIG nuclease family protein, partial [Xanthobacteraceae bacterium]